MAICQRSYRWLTGFALIICMTACVQGGVVASAHALVSSAHSSKGASSRQLPKQYRNERVRTAASRRFRVSEHRISKLKKSSFWNKRPYQFSTPLVAGERLYVGVDAGIFYAFTLPKGKKLWKFETDGPVQSKAAFAENTVFVGDAKGIVYAFNAEDGSLQWRTRLDTEILATPCLSGQRLYIATMSGRLFALDRGTGAEIWHTDAKEREFGFSIRRASSPTVSQGMIFYGTSSGLMLAVRESDGSLAWSNQLGDPQSQLYDVDSTPLVERGRIYVASADGSLYALQPQTGEIQWVSEAGGVNDVAYRDGRLYSSGGGSLYAVDPDTGFIFWQQDLEKPEISSPAPGEGFVAVASAIDKIYLIESSTGDIAYSSYIRRGSLGDPIVVDDHVFVLSNTGRLFDFRVRERVAKEAAKAGGGSR